MSAPDLIKGRYEIKDILGRGGMGVVYRAYDTVVRRDVALKTLLDAPDRSALDLFYKECDVLASMSHPNIVEIFDLGEFEEEGVGKPYFVMPLLPGVTLEQLIRTSSHRLTVDRSIEIIAQTCRGLQAAHERGLVHRDMKPSNVFVLEDDAVKVIDFGVAHMVDTRSTMGHKGTLLYMAPEQIEMKPLSALSDIFSLGVVAYETLTQRRPFERGSTTEIAQAILKQIPPPASELNPAVTQAISRVIHKAMAKQPWHRYSSAREFAETLQKAYRNEPIEFFDLGRIQPRIQRATKAFETGDFPFAGEILDELEAEGHVDPSIALLRRQIDQTARQRRILQLLENARTRFEQEEYPLALQKIQEVLDLDPSNAAALTLKNNIDSKRSASKMDEWFRLARQHLDNQAFAHARQALQNVLQIRSGETRALQLLSEVDRREQEYLRVRKEKEALYEASLEAWQNGEISMALSRLERLLELDRKSPETSAPDRSATYQKFYNQVRSDHDALRSAYDEARRHLEDGNFRAAVALCEEWLRRHPGHALFQALKFDVEERQRQDLSARIAEVDRKVEAERDLDRKVAILQQEVARHPGEAHFTRSLQLLQDKRDLVNSIVTKARNFEERGQFSEALGQWEILKTIYAQYPGLSFEIERVLKRREQQVHTEAKFRWVEQIDRHLEAGEYDRAMDLADDALGEFPEDGELLEMRKLAVQGLERAGEALRCLAEGQKHCAEQKTSEGLAALERAYELDERSPVIREALLETLLAQARALLEADWPASEKLLERALALDPRNTLGRSLRTLVEDKKRAAFMERCVAEARALQSAGDLGGALDRVEKGLALYPREARLMQLHATLSKALPPALRRTASLPPRGAPEAAPPTQARFATAAGGTAVPLVPAADAEAETVVDVTATDRGLTGTQVNRPEPPVAADLTPPAAASAPIPEAREAPPAAQRQRSGGKKGLLWAAAAIAVLVAGAVLVGVLRRGGAVAAGVPVSIETTPPGARIRINGEVRGRSALNLELPAGGYQIEASLEGYQPAVASITVQEGRETPVALVLQPLAHSVRLFTDLAGGRVWLDEQPIGELQDGQLILEEVAPGTHTLRVASQRSEATIRFETGPGMAPKLAGPVETRELRAVVVSNLGTQAHVHTTFGPVPAAVDGRAIGEAGPDGIEVTDVSPGEHELVLGQGAEERRMVLGTGPAPSLTAFLNSDRNVGTLVVLTGEDDVEVFLNGRALRRKTSRGQLRVANLEVAEYAVRVAKPGYQEEPEQRAAVRKGMEAKLEFRLRPVPTVASLVIRGAVPGAEVTLDRKPLGTVGSDGSFSASNLPPGEHSVEIRKDQYRPRQIRRQFNAGEAVVLESGDVALERALATLRINVAPAETRVMIARSGETPRAVVDTTLNLGEGSYTLTGRAPEHIEKTVTVSLIAGESRTVELHLMREAQKAAAVRGMADWEVPGGWTQESDWYFRRGGNFIGYRATPTTGTFVFTAMLRRGRRLQWVFHRIDDRNYALFQLDQRYFYRNHVVNGRSTELARTEHGLEKPEYYTLQIDVANGAIVHKVHDGTAWRTVDDWKEPGRNFTMGQFGLLIPGGDQVGISNFSFHPQ